MRLDARSKDESSQLIKNHYLSISRAENLAKLYITQITQSLINESIESKLNITKQGNKFILHYTNSKRTYWMSIRPSFATI